MRRMLKALLASSFLFISCGFVIAKAAEGDNEKYVHQWVDSLIARYAGQAISGQQRDAEVWWKLTCVARNVLRYMTSQRDIASSPSSNMAVFFQSSTHQPAKRITEPLWEEHHILQSGVLYFNMDEISPAKVLTSRIFLEPSLLCVILVLESETLVDQILKLVMTNRTFHWTTLIHVTEWVIVTSSNSLVSETIKRKPVPDFVTVISSTEPHVTSIQQKSRLEKLKEVLKVEVRNEQITSKLLDVYVIKLPPTDYQQPNRGTDHKSQNPEVSSDHEISDDVFHEIRKCGRPYLASRKSILYGAHLKISMLVYPDTSEKDLTKSVLSDNSTVFSGYYMNLTQLFADGLGFTYEFLVVNDSGFYGSVDKFGNLNGVAGHLARREAALSLMPLSSSEIRIPTVDFMFTYPIRMHSKIIYRLPELGSDLDTTYIDVIQSNVVPCLIGSFLILALIGGLVHVTSRSCTSVVPQPLSANSLKELYTFPDQMCFETHAYVNQSGRVLKATWGVFWLILSSAYSAYLTTSYAVKAKELRIDSLEALSQVQGYDIGIDGTLTHFISHITADALDPAMRQLHAKLTEMNRTNPMTFSANQNYHMSRVMQGHYAFLTVGPMPTFLVDEPWANDPLLHCYDIPPGENRIGVVKDAYFKEDMSRFLAAMLESSVSEKLKEFMFKVKQTSKMSLVKDETPVSLKRIELCVYVVLMLIGISLNFLLIEYLVDKCLQSRI